MFMSVFIFHVQFVLPTPPMSNFSRPHDRFVKKKNQKICRSWGYTIWREEKRREEKRKVKERGICKERSCSSFLLVVRTKEAVLIFESEELSRPLGNKFTGFEGSALTRTPASLSCEQVLLP